jgi:hypothetical protein
MPSDVASSAAALRANACTAAAAPDAATAAFAAPMARPAAAMPAATATPAAAVDTAVEAPRSCAWLVRRRVAVARSRTSCWASARAVAVSPRFAAALMSAVRAASSRFRVPNSRSSSAQRTVRNAECGSGSAAAAAQAARRRARARLARCRRCRAWTAARPLRAGRSIAARKGLRRQRNVLSTESATPQQAARACAHPAAWASWRRGSCAAARRHAADVGTSAHALVRLLHRCCWPALAPRGLQRCAARTATRAQGAARSEKVDGRCKVRKCPSTSVMLVCTRKTAAQVLHAAETGRLHHAQRVRRERRGGAWWPLARRSHAIFWPSSLACCTLIACHGGGGHIACRRAHQQGAGAHKQRALGARSRGLCRGRHGRTSAATTGLRHRGGLAGVAGECAACARANGRRATSALRGATARRTPGDAMASLERRMAAGTLLAGACRPHEVAWCAGTTVHASADDATTSTA